MYKIIGYGAVDVPVRMGGYVLATSEELVYANDIVNALACKFPGQWFGYSERVDGGTVYSIPIRITLEEKRL